MLILHKWILLFPNVFQMHSILKLSSMCYMITILKEKYLSIINFLSVASLLKINDIILFTYGADWIKCWYVWGWNILGKQGLICHGAKMTLDLLMLCLTTQVFISEQKFFKTLVLIHKLAEIFQNFTTGNQILYRYNIHVLSCFQVASKKQAKTQY